MYKLKIYKDSINYQVSVYMTDSYEDAESMRNYCEDMGWSVDYKVVKNESYISSKV
jgi:hypothetical protein